MAGRLSRRWRFEVDLRDHGFDVEDWAEVSRLCEGADSGLVVADGEDGERVDLEFNATHASIIFADDSRVLRPYFPGRDAASQDIDEFFCDGCGLRVGNLDGFLARCMDRGEGFRLCSELLRSGTLPEMMPTEGSGSALAVEWGDYPLPE